MGAKKPSKVRATAKTCTHPWAKAWNPRGCEGCLIERLSGLDHCDPKAKAHQARKQASESSQDAAQQLARGLRASSHHSIGAQEREAKRRQRPVDDHTPLQTVAEAAEVLDIAVEAVGDRIERGTLASPDL